MSEIETLDITEAEERAGLRRVYDLVDELPIPPDKTRKLAGYIARIEAERDKALARHGLFMVEGGPVVMATEYDALKAENDRLRVKKEKIAPVQGYSAGIPWAMHLRAYDVYCKKYGPQEALVNLEGRNCRGGFSTSELDVFIPGWREELSELHRLRAALDKATGPVSRWWFEEARPIINAIGEISVQEAMDAIERGLK